MRRICAGQVDAREIRKPACARNSRSRIAGSRHTYERHTGRIPRHANQPDRLPGRRPRIQPARQRLHDRGANPQLSNRPSLHCAGEENELGRVDRNTALSNPQPLASMLRCRDHLHATTYPAEFHHHQPGSEDQDAEPLLPLLRFRSCARDGYLGREDLDSCDRLASRCGLGACLNYFLDNRVALPQSLRLQFCEAYPSLRVESCCSNEIEPSRDRLRFQTRACRRGGC